MSSSASECIHLEHKSWCLPSPLFTIDSNQRFPTCAHCCAVSYSLIRPFQTRARTPTHDQVPDLKQPLPLIHVLNVNSSDPPPPPPPPSPRVNPTQNPSSASPPSFLIPPRPIRDLVHGPCPSRSHKMPLQGARTLPPGRHRLSNGLSVAKSACRVCSNLTHNNHKRVNPKARVRKCQPG